MKVRKSRRISKENFWVVDDWDATTDMYVSGYINLSGILTNSYFDYLTEAEAQAALDLYLEKQIAGVNDSNTSEKSETVRTFIGHPDGGLEVKNTKQYGHPRFYKILEQMKELHSRKNHDYAGTSDPLKNLRACERLELTPFMGVMVRLQDKWSRLEEFVKSGQLMVKNESVIDTLMDNAVYSVLGIILYEEQQKKDHLEPDLRMKP